ncbi:MAG: hypothetical protein OEV44_03730 [Spirochaetota bacterium]|nr:hypothetical protein [Spirochaetota bacterium]
MLYRSVIFFLLFEGCIGNRLLTPEKQSKPTLQDIYKSTFEKDELKHKKYESNQNVVKNNSAAGNSVLMKPDPALHKISESDKEELKKPLDKEEEPIIQRILKYNSHVVYTGNELIRDKEIIKSTGKSEVVTLIRGAAVVQYEQMIMKSFEIRIIGLNGDKAISNYPVFIQDNKSNTTLNAGFGEFFRSENRVYFNKKPIVTHVDKKTGEKTIIASDEMDRAFTTSVTRAYGHAIINYSDATAYAARVVYSEKEDQIQLDGNPAIYEKKNIYKADKLILNKKSKIAILDGNVRVLLTQEKKNTSDSREVITIITSDYAEYHYGETIKYVEFITNKKDSFVYVSRKDSDTYCQHLIARGEQLDEMELLENIYILDKENRTRLFGEYGNYNKKEQRSKVITRDDESGNPVHPVLIFYNKNDIITGKMSSEILDRDLEKKITYGRGNVLFELYEKTDNSRTSPELQSLIHGEWSEMEDEKKTIFIRGNPYIQNDQSKIFATEIVIYPDQNRLELLNSIKGIFAN